MWHDRGARIIAPHTGTVAEGTTEGVAQSGCAVYLQCIHAQLAGPGGSRCENEAIMHHYHFGPCQDADTLRSSGCTCVVVQCICSVYMHS